ncbi:MAG: hypothetical protein IJU16_07825 [Clostridia bacterium]|nr:hypothetical protein [Clostridia bacterium]
MRAKRHVWHTSLAAFGIGLLVAMVFPTHLVLIAATTALIVSACLHTKA